MRDNIIQAVASYFNSNAQWLDFLRNHLSYPESAEEIYHAHIYVDTSVHPESLHRIMHAFWDKQGHPLDRCIDKQAPKPNCGALHGCCPHGVTNFDFVFRFNGDVVLEPMPPHLPEAEYGSNSLSWSKGFQNDFYKGFDFKAIGPREMQEISDWFHSKHWKECLAHVMDPNVTHCHCNVEMNFDPGIIMLCAIEDMAKKGWTVERAYPSVYDTGEYTGKIVFLVGHPEKVFDICWKYNPEITIRRASRGWIHPEPGFDIWYISSYDAVVNSGKFIILSDKEIDAVISLLDKVI